MRILFVTPYVPSRIRVRPYNLIKSLSAMHEVSLVSLLVDDYERAMVEEIEKYCASVDLVPLPRWQAYANCLRALPTLTPLRVAYYRSAAFVQRIKEVIHRQKIDVVHGELIKIVPSLKAVLTSESVPILFDSIDCISLLPQQELATTRNPLKKAFVYSELKKMRHFEGSALRDFDQLIVVTERDRDELGRLTGQPEKISAVCNGVDTDYFTLWTGPRAEKKEHTCSPGRIPVPQTEFQSLGKTAPQGLPPHVVAPTLVFCAKLDYFPNARSIIRFCRETLPLIWRQRSEVRLTIVGNNPSPAVRALAADERITVTGYVPDTRPYLGTASIALAPLEIATGIQNKILEGLAMGLPVVTTPRCAHALGVQDGVHLLVAEGPQAYAEAVMKLLDDPQFAQQLGDAGRKFVSKQYSWASAANTLDGLYRSIVNAPEQACLAFSRTASSEVAC